MGLEGRDSSRTLCGVSGEWRAALATGEPCETEARLRRARRGISLVPASRRAAARRTGKHRSDGMERIPISRTGSRRKKFEPPQARQAGVRADVSAALSKPAPLGEILHGSAEAIVRHLDAAFARIWTLNKEKNMLELQASAGMYTHLDGPHSRIQVGKLKIGLIAQEKKPHLTNDVPNDPRVSDKAWAQNEGMVSFAGYPLIVQDRVVGVMAMFARQRLSAATLDTLASVADSIAQGIERKRAEDALAQGAGRARACHTGDDHGRTDSLHRSRSQPAALGRRANGNACSALAGAAIPQPRRSARSCARIVRDGKRASDVIAAFERSCRKPIPRKCRWTLTKPFKRSLF